MGPLLVASASCLASALQHLPPPPPSQPVLPCLLPLPPQELSNDKAAAEAELNAKLGTLR